MTLEPCTADQEHLNKQTFHGERIIGLVTGYSMITQKPDMSEWMVEWNSETNLAIARQQFGRQKERQGSHSRLVRVMPSGAVAAVD